MHRYPKVVLLVLFFACFVSGAWAQEPEHAPSIRQEHFEEYRDALIKDHAARASADDLYAAYRASCRSIEEEKTQALKENSGRVFAAADKAVAKALYMTEGRRIEQRLEQQARTLLEDLRSIGNKSSVEALWPSIERTVLRRSLLPACWIGMRSVDLVELSKPMPPSDSVSAIVAHYESELDILLKEERATRKRIDEWACDKRRYDERSVPRPLADLPELAQIQQQRFELDKRVEKLTASTLESLMRELPQEQHRTFEIGYLRLARPDVFVLSRPEILTRRAIANPTTSSDRRQTLQQLLETFVPKELDAQKKIMALKNDRSLREREVGSGLRPRPPRPNTPEEEEALKSAKTALEKVQAEWTTRLDRINSDEPPRRGDE